MDAILRCNDLNCRAQVDDRAVVTTCSHVFCLNCADRLELSAPKDGQRKCPACSTWLLNPDDAVVTSLAPTEDYKTSILSGLSPTIIMECVTRGLNFWAYQMAQEITYQEYLTKTLSDRYAGLDTHVQSVIREANDEAARMSAKLEAMHAEQQNVVAHNQKLDRELKEMTKRSGNYEKMYRALKHQQMNPGVEMAVEQDADNVIQGASQNPRGQYRDSQQQQHQPGLPRRHNSNGSGGSDERRRMTLQPGTGYGGQGYAPPGSRMGMTSSHSAPLPTSQRQRLPANLPQPTFGTYNASLLGRGTGFGDSHRQGTALAGSYSRGGQSGSPSTGYGMSAGIRTSRPGYLPQSRAGPVGGARPSGYAGMPLR